MLAAWKTLASLLLILSVSGHLCAETKPSRQSEHTREPLANLRRASGRVFSGGEPHGSRSFAELRRIGVRTVVSVDGIRPDVETAKEYGLRYVHIPVGYDGLSRSAEVSLFSLVREIRGKIYIHCHHGQHRGPAAAAVACMADGTFDKTAALRFLKHAGTDPRYVGLFRSVRNYNNPGPRTTLPPLVEVAEVDSLAESMAKIDRVFDQLTPQTQRGTAREDLALILEEVFRELSRTLHGGGESDPSKEGNADEGLADEGFAKLLRAASLSAEELRATHAKGSRASVEAAYQRMTQQCVDCHRQYRD